MPPSRPVQERNTFGKLMHLLGTTERAGVEGILDPLLYRVNPEAYARIQALRQGGQDVYGQQVAEAVWPPQQDDSFLEKAGRAVAGFGMGMAVDPLSYLAPGATHLGAAAAAKAGLRGSRLAAVPEHMLPAARSLRMKPDQLAVLRSLGGSEARTSVERAVVDSFWDAVPEIPAAHADRLREGLTSWLRFEIPFAKVSWTAREALETVGLARAGAALDAPAAAVLARIKAMGERMAHVSVIARPAHAIGTALDNAFNSHFTRTPGLVQAYNRMMEQIHVLKHKSVREVTESFGATHTDLVQQIAQETGRSADDVRRSLDSAMRQVIERTGYAGHGQLKSSKYRVQFNAEGKPVAEALAGGVDERIDEAMDMMRATIPELGGPAHPLDDQIARTIRDQARNSHLLHLAQSVREQQRTGRMLSIWGDGGYLMHQMGDEAAQQLKDVLPAYKDLVRKGGRGALPGEKFWSNLMRRWRVVVPQELESAKERLLGLTVRVGKKDVPIWTEDDFARILAGEMQDSPAFAEEVFDRLRASVRDVEPANALTLEEVSRLVHNYTVDEVNDYVWRFGLPNPETKELLIQPGVVKQFFKGGPEELLTARVVSGESHAIRAEFLDRVRQFGVHASKLETGIPEGMRTVGNLDALRGYYFRNDDAGMIEKIASFYGGGHEAASGFLKWYDKVMRVWKPYTLYTGGAIYWVRNQVGNSFLCYLAGVTPKDATLAMKARVAIRRHKWNTVLMKHPITGQSVTARDLFLAGEKRNLWNAGFMASSAEAEIPELRAFETSRVRRFERGRQLSQREIFESEWFPTPEKVNLDLLLGTRGPLIRAGVRASAFQEDTAKLAVLLRGLHDGRGMDDAIDLSKKFLFDYTANPPGESWRWITRAFPFAAWTKNNLPLQLEYLIKRPYTALNVQRAVRSMQSMTGVLGADEGLVSSWMRESNAMRLRKDKDGRYYYFTPVGWLPLYDLSEAFDLWSWVKSSMSPIPRGIIEQVANLDLMTGRQVDLLRTNLLDPSWATRGERKKLLGVSLPRRVAHTVRSSVRGVRVLDDLFANPEELAPFAQVMRTMVGRVYPLDVDRTRASFFKALKDLDSRYTKASASARSYRNVPEMRRIAREHRKARHELYTEWTGRQG